MSRVSKTALAADDLEEIWLHIASDNIYAADALIDTIDARARILADHPSMGRARPELDSAIRSYPVDSYILFYRPHTHGIELVRVLHASRDVPGIHDDGGFEG